MNYLPDAKCRLQESHNTGHEKYCGKDIAPGGILMLDTELWR